MDITNAQKKLRSIVKEKIKTKFNGKYPQEDIADLFKRCGVLIDSINTASDVNFEINECRKAINLEIDLFLQSQSQSVCDLLDRNIWERIERESDEWSSGMVGEN